MSSWCLRGVHGPSGLSFILFAFFFLSQLRCIFAACLPFSLSHIGLALYESRLFSASGCSCHGHSSPVKRAVSLNCAEHMAELEAQFSAAGFHMVAVQEGRMASRTVLSGNTCRMHVLERVAMWVRKRLTAALGQVTGASHRFLDTRHVAQGLHR